MIQNGEGYHYFAVKKLSALLRGTAKLHGDFYILKRLHSFETEKNVNLIKQYGEIKIFVVLK